MTPNAATPCLPIARPGACQTLRQYVSKSEEYFQSDTTFYFLSGTHWLDIPEPVIIMGNINALIFISNLRMIGDSRAIPSTQSFTQLEPSAVISCNSSASGFVFGFVQSLQIANLSFMHCGADITKVAAHLFPDIPKEFYVENITTALGFLAVKDLHLSGVLVQNNTGFGLTALNLFGNSSIMNSVFVFNRGDEYHPGGNALVYFLLIEKIYMCTYKTVNLNTTSSKFMHGSTVHFVGLQPSPPGLAIVLYQQCSHVTICINNSVFSDNYNQKDKTAFFGANLAILTVVPKYNSAFHTIMIDNCHIKGGKAGFGGGMALYASESFFNYTRPHASCTVNNTDHASSVQIMNTEIVQNAATNAAGGLSVFLNLCYKYIVQIRNTTFSGNTLVPVGESPNFGWWPKYLKSITGGNLDISIYLATPYQSVTIEDCIFSSGVHGSIWRCHRDYGAIFSSI